MRFAACSGLPRQQWQIKDKQVGLGELAVMYPTRSSLPLIQRNIVQLWFYYLIAKHIILSEISVPKIFNPGCSYFEQPLPDSALRGN